MKKFKKVLSFAAAFTMAMAIAAPVSALADTTFNIDSSATGWADTYVWIWDMSQDGNAIDKLSGASSDVLPDAWPGFKLEGKTFTTPADTFQIIFNGGDKVAQTVDLKQFYDGEFAGKSGTYDVNNFVETEELDGNGVKKWDCTITAAAGGSDAAATDTDAKKDTTTDAGQDKSPKTGDYAPIAVVAVVGLAAVVVVLATRKKTIA